MMRRSYINHIGLAVPEPDCHQTFLDSLPQWIDDAPTIDRLRLIAMRSGISHRHSVLRHPVGPSGSGAFYTPSGFPSTAERMRAYGREAPVLAEAACRDLEREGGNVSSATHLVITSCTGFYAPGLDIDLIKRLSLRHDIARTHIGFMGCYAGITGLRTANDIVRSDASARVLVVNVELCTLHLQEDAPFDRLISSLLFSDGCAASMVSAAPHGFRLEGFASHFASETEDRMRWDIGDHGFEMTLDAGIPGLIRDCLEAADSPLCSATNREGRLWAIHPGGRAILDSVQAGLNLTTDQMRASREVLRRYGNMSSATVMFVLRTLLENPTAGAECLEGHAIAFGPGLTVESATFSSVPEMPHHSGNSIEAETDSYHHPRPLCHV